MGLGIGTVLVILGVLLGLHLLPGETAAFGWTLAVVGVVVIAAALVLNGYRHRPAPRD